MTYHKPFHQRQIETIMEIIRISDVAANELSQLSRVDATLIAGSIREALRIETERSVEWQEAMWRHFSGVSFPEVQPIVEGGRAYRGGNSQ